MLIMYGNELLLMSYPEDVWKRAVPERSYPYTNEYDVVCEKHRILVSTSMGTGMLES
jgi:hypothetical protein